MKRAIVIMRRLIHTTLLLAYVICPVAYADNRQPMTGASTLRAFVSGPFAADIATALSDPSTNLGSMNFQFDHATFDGDIPDTFGPDNQVRLTISPVVKLPW